MRLALCNFLLALTFAGVSSTGLADENGGEWHNVNGEEVFVYGRGDSDSTHASSESQQRMEQHNQDIGAMRENEQRMLDLDQRMNGDSGKPNLPSTSQQIAPRPAQMQPHSAGAAQQQAAWAAQRRAAQQQQAARQQAARQQAALSAAQRQTPQQAALAGVFRQLQQHATNASAQRQQQQRAEWETAQHRRRIENAQRIVRQGPPRAPKESEDEPDDEFEAGSRDDGVAFPWKPARLATGGTTMILENMHRDTPDPKWTAYRQQQQDYAAARRDVRAAAEMKRRGIQYVPIQSPTIPRQGQPNQQNGPSLQRPLPSFGKWRR